MSTFLQRKKIIHPLFRKPSKLEINLKHYFTSILCRRRGGGGEKVNKKILDEAIQASYVCLSWFLGVREKMGAMFLCFMAGEGPKGSGDLVRS